MRTWRYPDLDLRAVAAVVVTLILLAWLVHLVNLAS